MAMRHAIAVGASAGGLEALLRVVKDLQRDVPAPLLAVIHCSPDFPSILPEILSRSGPQPAAHARDGEELSPGRIYVAPPGYHLGLDGERIRVWFGPKINGFRPAIDPLFRSVADNYGSGAIGVLLSGGLTDGVAGLLALKRAGGVTVVQDPADAAVPSLPHNALLAVGVDHVLPASEIGKILGRLARGSGATGVTDMPDTLTKTEDAARQDFAAQERGARAGQVSVYSCPHCGGVMRQTDEVRLAEFLCHVGHAYEGEALLAAQAENIETNGWNLMRALKEHALLARELASMARGRGDNEADNRLTQNADEADRHLALVENGLLKRPPQ